MIGFLMTSCFVNQFEEQFKKLRCNYTDRKEFGIISILHRYYFYCSTLYDRTIRR